MFKILQVKQVDRWSRETTNNGIWNKNKKWAGPIYKDHCKKQLKLAQGLFTMITLSSVKSAFIFPLSQAEWLPILAPIPFIKTWKTASLKLKKTLGTYIPPWLWLLLSPPCPLSCLEKHDNLNSPYLSLQFQHGLLPLTPAGCLK